MIHKTISKSRTIPIPPLVQVVAKSLRDKFPDKLFVLAGDDDKHLEATLGINPGRTIAIAAAKAVDGKAILPIFAPGEQTTDPKKFTDFNDLATNSSLGIDGIKRQVGTVVDSVAKKAENRSQHQAPEQQNDRVV